ncbi:MAG: hypothetical protein NTV98_01120 [Candidatus Roizmanbacteria bacterium]|nr:hypothetical protein [Candidatus Roizmanbacteria bacterium]
MKKIGMVFLGIGFGILFYVVFSFFFRQQRILSPIEGVDTNNVVQQNVKK